MKAQVQHLKNPQAVDKTITIGKDVRICFECGNTDTIVYDRGLLCSECNVFWVFEN